ncbi:MAG: hypothetical protein K2K97_05220, partial [Muribaculaceae bacterium]|nr:hypothetical protein [Muribaculaceae bacterium]
MYSYDDLMNMAPEQLRELASSMGMKKTSSAAQQDMAYYVIDSESEAHAKEAVAKGAGKRASKEKAPKEKKTKAKRSSNAKETSAETAATVQDKPTEPTPEKPAEPVAPAVEEVAPLQAETAVPKKRGRKPKVKEEDVDKGAEEPVVNESPDQAAPDADVPADSARENNVAPAEVNLPKEPRKRKAPRAQEGENPVENLPAVIEKEAEVPASKEQPDEVVSEDANAGDLARNVAAKKENPSLDAFFSNAKRRTFVPRSQKEIEEAEKAAAVAPIIIADPAPAKPLTPKQQKHLTKKQRMQ